MINFQLLSSYVNDLPATPSLLINLDDIPPQGASTGRWQMITTLPGKFIEFTASFSHADELGGELTSLLEAANTHFLAHDVLVDLPGRDLVRDFLAKDSDTLRVYESSGLDTEVTDQSSFSTLQAAGQQGNQVNYTLTAPPTAGFLYIKAPDPQQGSKPPTRALRSDGKLLSLDNIWLSKSRQAGKIHWNYFINLFDANSTGHYQLSLGEVVTGPRAPVLQYIPDQAVYVGSQIFFIVEASDPDGTIPMLSAAPLPVGAGFIDRGNGVGSFDWTPTPTQTGVYPITFSASDGALAATQAARITVALVVDSDHDSMPDDWEMRNFGALDRDGAGDYDDDGISDLDEYRNGADPRRPDVLKLSNGFNLIAYPAKVPTKHTTCKTLLTDLARPDAIDYLDRYNPTTQQFERCTAQGDVDFPIVAGEGYVLRLKTAAALPLSGEAVCPPITLSAGLNLIGHPTPPLGLSCYGLLTALGNDRIGVIQRYNPVRGAFESCTFYDRGDGAGTQPAGSDFLIRSGEGLLVHAITGGEINLPGCEN